MDDLAAWLRERLDEDERVAREALAHRPTPILIGPTEYDIKWRPPRVLAEVEAKRRILDDHDPDWPRPRCARGMS